MSGTQPHEASLEELVAEFQQALEHTQTNANALYQVIERRCAPAIAAVASQFRQQLGTEVDDVLSDVLFDCCRKFPKTPGQHFQSYLRVAAKNRAVQLYRNRKNTCNNPEPLEEVPQPPQSQLADEDFEDQMRLYSERKRRLLDQINLGSEAQQATMLLDQRHRLTAAVADADRVPAAERSAWVAAYERWTMADEQQRVSRREPVTTGCVWRAYAPKSNGAAVKIDQPLMVQTLRDVGLGITFEAWRQRIARYLREVRDQVDHEEWRLFHAKA